MAEWTGGCACGTVRYRLNTAPCDAGWCHCRTCQLNSGAPAMAFATVPFADYDVIEGREQVKRFSSSDFGWRIFCGECGTPLAMHVKHQPDTIDFSLATLDDPARAAPGFHIFYASRIPWAGVSDNLPRHDAFRPDTRGLEANRAE